MPSYHLALCKNPYKSFGSYGLNECVKLRCYKGSFYAVLDRANRMGIKPTREQALRLASKYCKAMSGNPSHSLQKFAQYIGYGLYQGGKWDTNDSDMSVDKWAYYVTPLSTKKPIGVLCDSIEKSKQDIKYQSLMLTEKEYVEFLTCPCGQTHNPNSDRELTNNSQYIFCDSCLEQALEIDAELNETAEVKRLLNKLKKVIKDENKKLTL